MKLGYIDYLNCYPFYHHMMTKSPLDGVKVVPAYPSALNAMMREGALDMSPVSSAAYADVRGAFILPGFCLSSIGYVRSVVLVSRVPIEELDGRTLGLSSASQTSVVLLKMLLERHYGVRPRVPPPRPCFQIDGPGDRQRGHDAQGRRSLYLRPGDLWLRKTGRGGCRVSGQRPPLSMRADAIAWWNRTVPLACLQSDDALIDAARASIRTWPTTSTPTTGAAPGFTDRLKSALAYYAQAADGARPPVGDAVHRYDPGG